MTPPTLKGASGALTRIRERAHQIIGHAPKQIPDEVAISRIWAPLVYDRLGGKQEIRLLRLAPSILLDAPVVCSLVTVALEDRPQYEALSYVWGDPSVTRPICLEGFQWSVTVNLEFALRHIRGKFKVNLVWADALCINQRSIEERNKQVALMQSIYVSASLGHIWLGEASQGSRYAMIMLKKYFDGEVFNDMRINGRSLSRNHLLSFIELISRPWWNRAWTQQEFALPPQLIIHCGRQFLSSKTTSKLDEFDPASIFFAGNAFVDIETQRWKRQRQLEATDDSRWIEAEANAAACDMATAFFHEFISMQRIYRGAREYMGLTDSLLIKILWHGRLLDCQEHHDRIYGLLGLANSEVSDNIEPDYTVPWPQALGKIAFQLTRNLKSLLLFSATEPRAASERVVPTWVPDWRSVSPQMAEWDSWRMRGDRLYALKNYSACGGREMVFETLNNSIVRVSGIRLGAYLSTNTSIICLIVSKDFRGLTGEKIVEWIQIWLQDLAFNRSDIQVPSYCITRGDHESFWKLLVGDLIFDEKSNLKQRCTSQDYKLYQDWLDHPGKNDDYEQSLRVNVSIAFGDRKLFFTSNGLFGAGPLDMQEEDVIYVLAGGNVPYVLRPVLGNATPDQLYELVGDCYVQDVMDGQAVKEVDGFPPVDWHDVYIQ